MTQQERVLAMLKAGPVCGTDFLRAYIPRYSARLLELRQAGYEWSRRPCRFSHHDHGSEQFVYELVAADQPSLF